jgi:hypothetical protein
VHKFGGMIAPLAALQRGTGFAFHKTKSRGAINTESGAGARMG